MTQELGLNLIEVMTKLLSSSDRAHVSAITATQFGADQLILFTKDDVTHLPLPAAGFPQTLPSGRRWINFIKDVSTEKVSRTILPSPYCDEETNVAAVQDDHGTVIALLGGSPNDEILLVLHTLLPLVGQALRSEQQARAESANAHQMRGEVRSARQLAKALDSARRELEIALTKASDETAAVERAGNDLQQVNEQLALARDQALAASQAKSAFLASMSHELRTPLTAVIGYAEMLQEEAVLPETKVDLGHIFNAGQHLLMLVNDILDMAKIEAGKAVATTETFQIEHLIQEAAQVVTPQAAMQENVITVYPPGNSLTMHTDRVKLRQIVVNLLSNAAKFTHKGTITLSAVISDTGESVIIDVSDTGVGIPPDELQNIFNEFTQLKTTNTHKTPGTGLGLSISRRLCHLLGGDINVKSTPGQGSTFTIDIPINLR